MAMLESNENERDKIKINNTLTSNSVSGVSCQHNRRSSEKSAHHAELIINLIIINIVVVHKRT